MTLMKGDLQQDQLIWAEKVYYVSLQQNLTRWSCHLTS